MGKNWIWKRDFEFQHYENFLFPEKIHVTYYVAVFKVKIIVWLFSKNYQMGIRYK